jgi:aminomethyltransferase
VGVFDVSHLGTVFVSGPAAGEVIARAFTGDPSAVAVGTSRYMLCCDEDGGIVDDLIVYHLDAPPAGADGDTWMVVPNAANTAAVVARLQAGSAEVADRSTAYAVLAVQGPDALALASRVLDTDVGAIPYLGLGTIALPTGGTGIVCRTGYTGEPGCEVICANESAPALWDALTAGGANPVGLGARDTLRLEMGYPLHGNDIGPDTDPFEARLGWAVQLDHGDFVGRAALAERKAAPPRRRLWGVRTDGRRPLRAGCDVRSCDTVVGALTSGGYSPTLQVGIGLAYLDAGVAPGDEVVVDVRGRDVPGVVVRPPFVDRDPRS